MYSLEQVFIKEFKQAVNLSGYKDIFKIPLPAETKTWEISGTALFGVQDIEDEYYSKLNKSLVSKFPSDKRLARRVIDKATRSFKRDEEGNFCFSDVTVPGGSMAVISGKKLGLPFNYKCEGFDYVDFIEKAEGTIEYIYIIPKKFLYQVNQTALVLSVKNMKNFSGMGYTTWNNGRIFLHVIPYKPSSTYIGSKVLKTGYGLDYSKEISLIVNFWILTGLIPNIRLTELATGENLALKKTDVGYEEYIPIETTSLGDKELYSSQGDEFNG